MEFKIDTKLIDGIIDLAASFMNADDEVKLINEFDNTINYIIDNKENIITKLGEEWRDEIESGIEIYLPMFNALLKKEAKKMKKENK